MVTESPELIGAKLGNYRLTRLLGRGRMGVVFLARDEALLRPTAIKVLSWLTPQQDGQDPEVWFLAEARNVARVKHPNVVQIYGVAKHGTHCYIAMEYVDGPPAETCIAESGPFSLERATEILLQTGSALQAAHDANVVHRDVKPGNLLIGSDGQAKLGDFGMALHLARKGATDVVRAGTPYYTAPEIWRGEPATPASDIYALGATYFHLLTGRPPYDARDLESLIAAHLDSEGPDLAKLHPESAEIVRRCLAKSPADRYASAQVLGWEARGMLHRLRQQSRLSVTAVPLVSSGKPSERSPASWWSELGFTGEPFGPCDSLDVPYNGEPFESLRAALARWLDEGPSSSLLLLGEKGSGRSSLAHRLMGARGEHAAAYLRLDETSSARPLGPQVSRAFGLVPGPASSANGDIDRLLEHLAPAHRAAPVPALLVLDDFAPSRRSVEDLGPLLRAAAATHLFRVLVVGSPDLKEQLAPILAREGEAEIACMSMPALSTAQSLRYIAQWLAATHPSGGRSVVLTQDAAALVAHRSQGNLTRINRLTQSMLERAWRKKRRVVDSWDAWMADPDGSRAGSPIPPSRPNVWPSSEVLTILNDKRAEVGVAPRRRT